jgi:hypothetical protein
MNRIYPIYILSAFYLFRKGEHSAVLWSVDTTFFIAWVAEFNVYISQVTLGVHENQLAKKMKTQDAYAYFNLPLIRQPSLFYISSTTVPGRVHPKFISAIVRLVA